MKRLLLPLLLAAFCIAVPARAEDTVLVFGKQNSIDPPYDAFEEVWFLLGEITRYVDPST